MLKKKKTTNADKKPKAFPIKLNCSLRIFEGKAGGGHPGSEMLLGAGGARASAPHSKGNSAFAEQAPLTLPLKLKVKNSERLSLCLAVRFPGSDLETQFRLCRAKLNVQ